ncbi:MAG: serine hydrolase domain-containing protein [Hyphomonadaceae bacterium]
MRITLFATLGLLAACQSVPQDSARTPQPLAPSMIAAAERSRAPGMVAAIIRDGRVVQAFSWGGMACDGSGAADVNAAYEIGSISKHITAVALLQLWERNLVDLDATVGTYLDDIPEAWKSVTLRQLLTHTSGVPDYEEAGGYGVYETSPTPAQVYAIVGDRPLDFEPGASWSYSNTGYFLLSQVVQRVSGERFGEYLRAHLFEPLGMHHTFMGGYAPEGVTLAQGCRPGDTPDAARVAVRPITEASTFGAGGISSTLADWALWDDALYGGHVLSPRAMEALFTTQHLADGSDTGYAFGMFRDEYRGVSRLEHSGQTQGFSANYEHFPDRDVSMVVFANSYGTRFGGVVRALEAQVLPDRSYDLLPVPVDPDPQRTLTVRRALRQIALAEQPLDLLAPDVRAAALDPQMTSALAPLRPHAEHADQVVFLRSDPPDGEYTRDIYKSVIDGETSYLLFTWHDGLLAGLRIEDE